MAQQVVVEMVDDLDGSVGEDVTTVAFALDGHTYEIDLCDRNADNLRTSLAEFVAASRRQRGERGSRRARSNTSSTDQDARQRAQAIREWARGAGHELSERGRIPANVVQEYEQAQQSEAATEPSAAQRGAEEPAGVATPANLPSFSG